MCQSCYTYDTGNTYVSDATQMIQVIPMCQSCYTDDTGNPDVSVMRVA
jgi:hypothetical protein